MRGLGSQGNREELMLTGLTVGAVIDAVRSLIAGKAAFFTF